MQINEKKLKYKTSYYYFLLRSIYYIRYNSKQRKTNVVCKIYMTISLTASKRGRRRGRFTGIISILFTL